MPKKEKKQKEHEHQPYPTQLFVCENYLFAIVKLECLEENCDWMVWDIAPAAEL